MKYQNDIVALLMILTFTIRETAQLSDAEKKTLLVSPIDKKHANNFKHMQDRYYKLTSLTFQQSCSVVKFFGGVWSHAWFNVRVNQPKEFKAAEGSKAVCMDNLMNSIKDGTCLIYSFGIGNDWSFEDTMGSLGCKVRAFDPTIDSPEQRSQNVTFEKIGIAYGSGTAEVVGQPAFVMSLHDIMKKHGELEKEITYIKLDVERYEVKFLPLWAKSPDLDHVRQIGVEMHMGRIDTIKDYSKLIKAFQEFYQRGLHIVSYRPNLCVDKQRDFENLFHTHFDILLVNTNFISKPK